MFHHAAKRWRRNWCRCASYFLLNFLLICTFSTRSLAQEPLILAEASRRALDNHPELQVFQWRFNSLKAMRQSADLKPAYQLGVEVENFAGSGHLSGLDSAELTLSLSSVIELGDKRESRISVADSRYAMAAAERAAKALDVLGAVTQGFIATLSLQLKLGVAQEATELAQQSYQLVSARVQRGAAPAVERLRAQAALTQSKIQQNALVAELASRKFALASLWQADRADFDQVRGDLFNFDEPSSFEALYQRVAASPYIDIYASEQRLRDAEIALVRSQSTSNVQWSLGIRRFEDTGDSAFTAGISVPLFSGRRNRNEVQSALAEQAMIQAQRDAAMLNTRARLFEAWQTYQQSASAARQIRAEVLPALVQALEQTRQAYERGRYSYVDWVTAQRELLDARMAAIDAASTALLNQALIEQLTAEPLATETPRR